MVLRLTAISLGADSNPSGKYRALISAADVFAREYADDMCAADFVRFCRLIGRSIAKRAPTEFRNPNGEHSSR